MIKKVLISSIIFLLFSTQVNAQTNQQIEIFDINQGKVIKYAQTSSEIQQEVGQLLGRINGAYIKYNPIPNKGFMIRIPLEPNFMVKNQWFDDLVDEVTLIFPDQEDPYLMVFDDENKPYFLTFEGSTERVLRLLDFNH